MFSHVWVWQVGYGEARYVRVMRGKVWFGRRGKFRYVKFGSVRVRQGRRVVVGFGTARSVEAVLGAVRLVMVRQARYGKLCLVGFSCVTASYGRRG